MSAEQLLFLFVRLGSQKLHCFYCQLRGQQFYSVTIRLYNYCDDLLFECTFTVMTRFLTTRPEFVAGSLPVKNEEKTLTSSCGCWRNFTKTGLCMITWKGMSLPGRRCARLQKPWHEDWPSSMMKSQPQIHWWELICLYQSEAVNGLAGSVQSLKNWESWGKIMCLFSNLEKWGFGPRSSKVLEFHDNGQRVLRRGILGRKKGKEGKWCIMKGIKFI